MWLCEKCGYKNSDSSLDCHNVGCNGKRPKTFIDKNRVLDFCPKCLHNTFWIKSKFHQKYMKANGTTARKWINTWKCEECGRHAKMVAPPIKTAEQLAIEEGES